MTPQSVYRTRAFSLGFTELGERRVPAWWFVAKRATDVAIATTALVVSAPIIAAAAAAVTLSTKGSPIFVQERVGKDGRPFRMFKLRTMVSGAHLMHDELRSRSDVTGPVFKMKDDPRCFPIGRLLRRTSIDELPNFINVLLGDMSVVGPRPGLPHEVAHYDWYAKRRLAVKPGITCLWQISGRSSIDFDEWMDLDNCYIDSWSPLGDLAIVAETIPAVLRAKGAH